MSKGYVSAELTQGRTVVARIKPGQEVVATVSQILKAHNIQQAHIPTLLGGFQKLRLASMVPSGNPSHPKDIVTEYTDPLDYFGTGTVASHNDKPVMHVHLTAAGGTTKGVTGHLLYGEVVFLAEIVIVELTGVNMMRKEDPEVYGMPLLDFGPTIGTTL